MDVSVLIVDDSAILRKAIRKCVKQVGVDNSQIREAGDGQEALAQIDESMPDLVLLDVHMPVMDGEQFLEVVNERGLTNLMKVLIVSTEANLQRLARLAKLGAKGRLHKPFEPEQLSDLVEKVMRTA